MEESREEGQVVRSELLPKVTGDLLLVNEAVDLDSSLVQEPLAPLDEVEEVA